MKLIEILNIGVILGELPFPRGKMLNFLEGLIG